MFLELYGPWYLQGGDILGKGFQYLLQASENLRIISKNGNTLLHFARNLREAEAQLNKTGCSISQRNSRGYTPLMVLLRFRNPTLIRRVVSEGAVVNAVDNKTMSALHHLINNIHGSQWWAEETRNCVDSIAALLVSGADVLQGDSCLCAAMLLDVRQQAASLIHSDLFYEQRRDTLCRIMAAEVVYPVEAFEITSSPLVTSRTVQVPRIRRAWHDTYLLC